MKKIKLNIIASYALLTVVAIATSIAGLYTAGKLKKAEQPIPVVIKPSEFPDYDAYNGIQKSLILVQDQNSYSPAGGPIVGRIRKNILVRGKFSRAYLYMEASVDNGKPLTQWDSVFVSLQYVGGHVFRPDSLSVPASDTTKLLYGINQIPFVTTIPYSDSKKPVVKDWFGSLKNGNKLYFDTFLSSLRIGGKLNLIEIRYECEQASDCELTTQ